jgi:hypothetical protein
MSKCSLPYMPSSLTRSIRRIFPESVAQSMPKRADGALSIAERMMVQAAAASEEAAAAAAAKAAEIQALARAQARATRVNGEASSA